ncbi:hypothetical protein B0H12DRAFT_1016061 [Mycena haematopus]|nr:hypothetical protein B0H12DRAFT_1016061 [Mycena haematopus]
MSTASKYATVTRKPGHLPTFHKGEVTALACSEFQDALCNYFAHKDTAADRQVSIALGCFEDMKINNWTRPAVTRERLRKLTFSAFMSEFKKKFLRADWKESTRKEILSSRMKDTESFDDWSTSVMSLAALLADDPAASTVALDDKRIRHTLEAGMVPDLTHLYSDHATASQIGEDDFDEWLRVVTDIDERRTYDDARIARILAKRKAGTGTDDTDRASKKSNKGSAPASTSSKPASSASTGSDAKAFCPPLTADERELLNEHDGCNKCRQFYAGHKAGKCTNGFPDPATYKTLTAETAAVARKASKGKAVAVVMPAVEDDEDSDDEDDSSMVSTRIPAPEYPRSRSTRVTSRHRAKHLLWDCLIEGPMSNLPLEIRVLIDNGSFLVLIDALLADKLGLRRFKLLKPEPISLALSDTKNDASTYLAEYVKLKVLSCDQTWSSTSVRALVAPNLCVPIILGLPWLEKNKIIIDHSARTVIDKRVNYDLLNPPLPKAPDLFEQVKPVDVIAAVRARVEILAHWEELQDRGDKIRADYPMLFEPMPHADLLPTDVLCEIKVKNANHNIETRSYRSPRKYREAWQTLIQNHLDAGRIRPSTSPHASPAFLIPKSDKTALPRWVNDFRPLNAETVRDAFPLPRIEDILADCGRGGYGRLSTSPIVFFRRVCTLTP